MQTSESLSSSGVFQVIVGPSIWQNNLLTMPEGICVLKEINVKYSAHSGRVQSCISFRGWLGGVNCK